MARLAATSLNLLASETTTGRDPVSYGFLLYGKPAQFISMVSLLVAERARNEQGIPVGTPYLEGFPPSDEFPTATWLAQLVATVLRIVVGTIRCD